jgi:hypothetical protein
MKVFDQKPSPKIWYIILSMWWAVIKKFSLHFDILLMKSMVFWCWLENVLEIDMPYKILVCQVNGIQPDFSVEEWQQINWQDFFLPPPVISFCLWD